MHEEESFQVHRPHAYREIVRQGVQSKGEEMARDGQRKVVKIMGGGDGVDGDRLHGGLAEDEGVQRGGGRDIPPGG